MFLSCWPFAGYPQLVNVSWCNLCRAFVHQVTVLEVRAPGHSADDPGRLWACSVASGLSVRLWRDKASVGDVLWGGAQVKAHPRRTEGGHIWSQSPLLGTFLPHKRCCLWGHALVKIRKGAKGRASNPSTMVSSLHRGCLVDCSFCLSHHNHWLVLSFLFRRRPHQARAEGVFTTSPSDLTREHHAELRYVLVLDKANRGPLTTETEVSGDLSSSSAAVSSSLAASVTLYAPPWHSYNGNANANTHSSSSSSSSSNRHDGGIPAPAFLTSDLSAMDTFVQRRRIQEQNRRLRQAGQNATGATPNGRDDARGGQSILGNGSDGSDNRHRALSAGGEGMQWPYRLIMVVRLFFHAIGSCPRHASFPSARLLIGDQRRALNALSPPPLKAWACSVLLVSLT
jgi:hypothetical protein